MNQTEIDTRKARFQAMTNVQLNQHVVAYLTRELDAENINAYPELAKLCTDVPDFCQDGSHMWRMVQTLQSQGELHFSRQAVGFAADDLKFGVNETTTHGNLRALVIVFLSVAY